MIVISNSLIIHHSPSQPISIVLLKHKPSQFIYKSHTPSHFPIVCTLCVFRIASSNNTSKSESDQEDNDDINDNDWSYGSEKKRELSSIGHLFQLFSL